MVTHERDIAQRVTRTITLADGEIVNAGEMLRA
jgi:predicted ABC-type transport system involved in lysophospholipase L1 biosynthesis ATPase subunit